MAWDYRPMVLLYGICIMEEKGQMRTFLSVVHTGWERNALLMNSLTNFQVEVVANSSIIQGNQTKAVNWRLLWVQVIGNMLHEAMGHSF